MTRGASITLDHVGISFGDAHIVSNVTLEIRPGEFVCLLGPSGCGKSTLLNAIAGFLPVNGRIAVNGRPVAGPGLDRGVVFQSSEVLFPWLTIRENVEYGLRLKGVPTAVRREKADHFLGLVGLVHAADKFPAQLSGGMRQRAQIARVLINEPHVVLMDEPFGALDAMTRQSLQDEVLALHAETAATIVFVTHDLEEAIYLGDRVVGLLPHPGRVGIDIDIRLPRPRNQLATREDPEFLRLRRVLFDFIEKSEGHRT